MISYDHFEHWYIIQHEVFLITELQSYMEIEVYAYRMGYFSFSIIDYINCLLYLNLFSRNVGEAQDIG